MTIAWRTGMPMADGPRRGAGPAGTAMAQEEERQW